MSNTEKIALFERFELILPEQAVQECHHQGACDDDVDYWHGRLPDLFKGIDPQKIRDELREYGAWDDEELADATANEKRILWLAAGEIQEEERLAESYQPLTT